MPLLSFNSYAHKIISSHSFTFILYVSFSSSWEYQDIKFASIRETEAGQFYLLTLCRVRGSIHVTKKKLFGIVPGGS